MRKDIDLEDFKNLLKEKLAVAVARREGQEKDEAPVELVINPEWAVYHVWMPCSSRLWLKLAAAVPSWSDNESCRHLTVYNPATMATV